MKRFYIHIRVSACAQVFKKCAVVLSLLLCVQQALGAAATITSFSPQSATPGDTLTITGSGLSSVTGVNIEGLDQAFTIVSDNIIKAVIGRATSGSVYVLSPNGNGLLAGFTYINPPAAILNSFSPQSAHAGDVITVHGKYLLSTRAVVFYGTNATAFSVVSDTVITITVPAAVSNSISIITDGGVSTLNGYTYIPPPPVVTSFTPASAPTAGTVTINGSGFIGITSVAFNGVAASSFTVVSDTKIMAVVGIGASGDVSVTNPGGTSTQAGFTYLPVPVITSFSPAEAGVGATITIKGANFTGATTVSIAGAAAASFTVVSDTVLTAVTGHGAIGDIIVTTPSGTAQVSGFNLLAPHMTDFSPKALGAGDTVTITGRLFNGVVAVKFGGTPATSFEIISDSLIKAVVGNGASGFLEVNGAGGGNGLAGFQFIPVPTITSFSPMAAGTDSIVIISGTGLNLVTAVSFGGVPAASFTYTNGTFLAKPASGASGDVSITNVGGTATLPGFTYLPAPVVSSFSPGSTHVGDIVTITGSNFTGATGVYLDIYAQPSFTVVSDNEITFYVAGPYPGHVKVVGAGGTGTAGIFTIAAPIISSFSPQTGIYGTAVTIKGHNFTGAYYAGFGGVTTATTVVSDSIIIATLGPTGASGPVSVTTPGGTVSSVDEFTFIPAPAITSFSPASVPAGGTVTIHGSALTTTTQVSFGGISAASFTVVSDTIVTAVVAQSGVSGDVSLYTVAGPATAHGFLISSPVITAFSPGSAAKGDTVTINGEALSGTTRVKFGDIDATSFSVLSDSVITAVVANGLSGDVRVTTPGGVAVQAGFNFIDPPAITQFSPSSAGRDSIVTITGSHFTGATAVSFGDSAVSSFTVVSDNTITAVIGNGASGFVSITGPGGTAVKTTQIFFFLPAPVITGISPDSASAGYEIYISGENLVNPTSVSFGGVPAASFRQAANNLIAAVPGLGASGEIVLTTTGGTARFAGFKYAAPKIFNLSSFAIAAGQTVNINGAYLQGATAVSFGGVPVTSFTSLAINSLQVVLGNGAPGPLSVTTPGGTTTFSDFAFVLPPTITYLSTPYGAQGSQVEIHGTGFTYMTSVSFGGTPVNSFFALSDTVIGAYVGSGATGDVSVTNIAGTASIPGFIYVNKPEISSFTPASTHIGGTVTIKGKNFTGVTSVQVGYAAATSFTIVSDSEIIAIAGSGPGTTGTVIISNVAGTVSMFGFSLAAPVITQVSPGAAHQGDYVEITGANFTGTTVVKLGGTAAASFTVESDTLIRAVVGNGATGQVTIETPVAAVAQNHFTFIPPPAVITSFSPTAGIIGNVVDIYGSNLSTTSAVSFGGTPATSFTVVDDGHIYAVVGTGSSGDIAVTTLASTVTAPGFTIAPASISNYSTALAEPGATIDIFGSNLTGASSVSFGGTAAAFFIVTSNTHITAVLAGGSNGDIRGVTPQGTATYSGFALQPPVFTYPLRNYGRTGDTISLVGHYLRYTTAVSFGGTPAVFFVVKSADTVIAKVGDGSSGDISITTLGGTATYPGFNYIPPAPVITSFSPQQAPVYSNVTIKGRYFIGVTNVFFGTVAASSFTVLSDSVITATVYYGESGSVTVDAAGGSGSLAGFTIAPPVITSFSPTRAAAFQTVTIKGANFTNAMWVRFGGVDANQFSVVSDSVITARVGNGGASGSISVSSTYTGEGSLDGFVFAEAPTISSVSPQPAYYGSVMTIKGKNFTGTTLVAFGNYNSQSYAVQSDSVIIATITYPGTQPAKVFTPIGSAQKGFMFVGDPVISSFTPTTGHVGTVITINGSNFTGTTSVMVGGVEVESFTLQSDNVITAVIGNTYGGRITVTNPSNGITSADEFVIPAPVLTSFAPQTARPGDTVTIQGQNLLGVTNVDFSGNPAASFSILSDTVIAAIVGNGSSGYIAVTAPTGQKIINGFTFIPLAPVVTSFTPTNATANNTVTINGNYFTGATAVSFGGTPASGFYVQSSHVIIATVALGSSGDVAVTTAGGTGTLAGFTYTIPAPVIYYFTPQAAHTGDVVTINGQYLTGTSEVSFGGVQATSFTVVSDGQVTAVVAEGASGNVALTTPGGTATQGGFNYLTPAPVVTSFFPTTAGLGGLVTIYGKHFTGAVNVTLATASAASFTVVSDTVITAIVGGGFAGITGDVGVQTPVGYGPLGGLTISAPVVTGFTPESANPGDTITITGKYLTGAYAVYFGGVQATAFNAHSDTVVTAVVGNGSSGYVSVYNIIGGGSTPGFTMAAPIISFISPSSTGAGGFVYIYGNNFTSATGVSFGGVPAASFTVQNDATIQAIVGAGASGDVVVTKPRGADTLENAFTFALPYINSFDPANASAGQTVTINGGYFTGVTAVSFGGTPAASFTVQSANEITAVLGSGATGDVSVTTAGGSGSRPGFGYYAMPVITSFTPTASGVFATVTIKGTGFTGTNLVTFGDTYAYTFTVVSDSVITAMTGYGASGNVTVTNPIGTASLAGFTYVPRPVINGFTPQSGGAGVTVTINGFYFTGATDVSFGGIPAASFNVVSDNVITAVVGNGMPGPVTVTSIGGTGTGYGFKMPYATIDGAGSACKDNFSPFVRIIGYDGVPSYTFTYNINGGANQTISTEGGDRAYIYPPTQTAGTFTYNVVSITDGNGNTVPQNASFTVTISAPTTSNTVVSICSSELPYVWHRKTYYGAGTYTFDSTNVSGCDSIMTLTLALQRSSTTFATVNKADMPYHWNGNEYNTGGVYTFTIPGAPGDCDSVATLRLTEIIPLAPATFSYNTPNVFVKDTAVRALKPVLTQAGTAASYATGITQFGGIAADTSGNIYVTDIYAGVVLKLSPDGTSTTLGSGFAYPLGIAADAGGNVYVSSAGDGSINKIASADGAVTTMATGLSMAYGIAADNAGNVYVPQGPGHAVKKITPAGEVTTFWTDNNTPVVVYADAAANVYVGDQAGLITKITADGKAIALGTINGLPAGITTDAAGNVYVKDYNHGIVQKLTPGDSVITVAQDINGAYGLAVDAGGNIYVQDDDAGVINKIQGATAPVTGYTITPALPAGLRMNNSGIISGTATVASPQTNYTITGSNAGGSAATTVSIAVTNKPGDAFSYTGPNLFTQNKTISDLAPVILPAPVSEGAITTLGKGFNNPSGVVTDAAGNIYVSDAYNGKVKKISADGSKVTTLSSDFYEPAGIAVDAAGNVYVADYGAGRVRKIAANSTTVTAVGPRVSGAMGVALDAAGNVYVTDIDNGEVKKILPDGTAQTLSSDFDSPAGITVDAAGNVYVSDYDDNVIKKITPAGHVETIAEDGLYGPFDLKLDAAGNLYIANYDASGIIKRAANGDITSIGSGFNEPSGLALDAAGSIYVADSRNNAVKKIAGAGQLVTEFTITPPLPAGLTMQPATGIITGKPTAGSAKTTYTVNAVRSGGNLVTQVDIAVKAIDTTYANVCVSTLPYYWRGVAYTVPGTYSINATGAIDTSATLVLKVFANPAASLAINGKDSVCYGLKTTITTTATDGTRPYLYSIDGVNYQAARGFTVTGGNYAVTVKDVYGCTVVTNNVTIIQPAAKLTIDSISVRNDVITVSPSGGYGNYKYFVNGVQNVTNSYTSTRTGDTVLVTDAGGCSIAKAVVRLAATLVAENNNTQVCVGTKRKITVTVTSGKAPYVYSLDGITYQTSNSFGVTAGTYSVQVKDAYNSTYTTNSITITQPAVSVSITLSKTDVSCKGGSDGSITATAANGYPGYTYRLNTGSYDAANVFTNLAAGKYVVSAKNTNGCIVSSSTTIKQPATPCSSLRGDDNPTSNTAAMQGELKVKVMPNPAQVEFNLQVISGDSKKVVELRVMDMTGKVVYHTQGSVFDMYKFGRTFAGGIYIAEVLNGKNIQRIKLVKGN